MEYFYMIIEVPEEYGYDVEVKVEYSIESDSIGQYEYWGHICYDNQPDYVQVNDIVYEGELFSKEIGQYINDNYDEIEEHAYLYIEHMGDDYYM